MEHIYGTTYILNETTEEGCVRSSKAFVNF